MSQFVKSVAVKTLALANGFPTTLTDKEAIVSLMRKLSPVNLDKPFIRLGPQGDGGYLVPDDLTGIEACFSPGVCLVSGFEKDCADLGMQVFMADRSVEHPADNHPSFHFIQKYVGVTSNDDFMTVDHWVETSLPHTSSDLLLQIDIEGYEYETFLGMSDSLMQRYRIIVAEFHSLEQLWNRPFFLIASRVFEKILQTHVCVHIHPNNYHPAFEKAGLSIPRVAEFTFVRKDRVDHLTPSRVFPHPLDGDNDPDQPHYALPACWYGQ